MFSSLRIFLIASISCQIRCKVIVSHKQTKCEETLKRENSKYDYKTLELSYSQDFEC